MNKYNKISRQIFLLFFIIPLLLIIWSLGDCINEIHDKRRHFNGLIIEKYIDSSAHNTYSLRLDNSKIYRLVGFDYINGGNSSVYDSILVGDSLIKHKGSLDLIIVRNDQKMIFTHDNVCDENWWKFWEKLKF